MSEEKVIQHAGNALQVLKDKEKGWGSKVKEFFGEIFIIVIAVSLTLLLHNWNDHLHERHLEREFLVGIKSDLDTGSARLLNGIQYFKPDIEFFVNARKQLSATHRINLAYLDSNSGYLRNTLYFDFDMGRFEGFKSSGYLRLIQNQTLLKHLMSMYTVSIPFQIEADRMLFDERRHFYDEHIGPKVPFLLEDPVSETPAVSKLIDDPSFQYYIVNYASFLQEKQRQKLELVAAMKKLSAEIALELDN
jgi:hypothetical protein